MVARICEYIQSHCIVCYVNYISIKLFLKRRVHNMGMHGIHCVKICIKDDSNKDMRGGFVSSA